MCNLPLALPGIAGGAILAFARGLGEFGATAMIAGNIATKQGPYHWQYIRGCRRKYEGCLTLCNNSGVDFFPSVVLTNYFSGRKGST